MVDWESADAVKRVVKVTLEVVEARLSTASALDLPTNGTSKHMNTIT